MITVIVSTSPRPSHPATRVLDRTIVSVKAQLPNVPIIITCDGIPSDAPHDTHIRYGGFKEAIQGRYDNTRVIPFEQHQHQSGMLGIALAMVDTPVLLYLEDDWEFLSYPPIEWEKLCTLITGGWTNYIRLFPQHRIHPLHEHMMKARVIFGDVPLVLHNQWSQNPHLASTEFYRKEVLPRCQTRTDYIENIMHGIGMDGLATYNPREGVSMMVCQHIDGDQE